MCNNRSNGYYVTVKPAQQVLHVYIVCTAVVKYSYEQDTPHGFYTCIGVVHITCMDSYVSRMCALIILVHDVRTFTPFHL